MGNTYKYNINGRSVSYKSDHARGTVRKNDRHSRHSLRNDNRYADELTFETRPKISHRSSLDILSSTK